MARSGNKTKPTATSPNDVLAAIENPKRQADAIALLSLFERTTGLPAKMWGATMIGFGRYAYTYDSGCSGEYFLTGFSPRAKAISIYILPGYRDMSEKLARLGKHKTGKSCLYVNKLVDIDTGVLEEIIRDGLDYMHANYKTWPE